MLSVVALIGVSHAVNLSDAVAESERWERIRHVAVEAIPRINAGGLVAKRALLECIATVSEPDAAEVSSHLEMIPVTFLRWLCVCLMLQILTTVGVLDVAATLMKRPSSSETIRGDMFACF